MNLSTSVYAAEFCALDLETTGINPYIDKIIEVGAVRFTIDGPIVEYQTMINPARHIPEQVSLIHGITDDMVTDAPLCRNILPELIRFIGDAPLIIHNSRFDISFMEMECRHAGIRIPQWESYDTVIFSRRSFPDIFNHKLDTLCSHFNVPLTHHRALQDALGCMEIFRRCVKAKDPGRGWNFAQLNAYSGGAEPSGLIQELQIKERRGGKIVVGKEVVIRYIDGEGNTTERKILPKKIYKKGKQTVVLAHCFLRDEERFFKVNRIDEVLPVR